MEMRLINKKDEVRPLAERFPNKKSVSKKGVWRLHDSEYVLKGCLVRLRMYPDYEGVQNLEYVNASGSNKYEFRFSPESLVFHYRLYRHHREVFQMIFRLKKLNDEVQVLSVFSDFNPDMETDSHIKTGFDFLESHLNGNEYI